MLKHTTVQLFKHIVLDDLYYVLTLVYMGVTSFGLGLLIGFIWTASL